MKVLFAIQTLNESAGSLNVANLDIPLGIANLLLEYLKVLIWPFLILYILTKYEKYIHILFKRVAEESKEISSDIFGLNVKFWKDVSNVSKEAPTESTKESLKRIVSQFPKDKFKLLSNNFFGKSIQIRIKTAEEISDLAKDMELKDILQFWQSSLPGERVSAAIGIGTHIKFHKNTEKDNKVLIALKEGFTDTYSKVRFRIVETIGKSEYLVNNFKVELSTVATHDENHVVRNKANEILKNI